MISPEGACQALPYFSYPGQFPKIPFVRSWPPKQFLLSQLPTLPVSGRLHSCHAVEL